ncbi:MAG: flagellar biosynthesis anti-sigma factor FlgM [Terriglobia bacterium]
MRINGALPLPENLQTQKVATSGGTPSQISPTPAGSRQDLAQLSLDNTTMQRLKATLAQVPEIRQERVQALSQAISGGSYQISDQQLSDAIGADLLGRVTG